MALLRDKYTGLPVKNSKGDNIKITTPGETMAREIREEKLKAKIKKRKDNAKARAKRSAEQQLAVLDERLGVNIGATKERARLVKEIQNRAELEEAKAKQKEEAKKLKTKRDGKKKK